MTGNLKTPETGDRRSFLGKMTGLMATSVAAVLAVIGGKFAISPAFRRTPEELAWQTVGSLDEIPDHEPVKRSIVISQDGGWGDFNAQRLIWVIRERGQVTVFSASCPHLGCTVNVAPNGFVCPCHGSAWNREGQRMGGPTPRDLDRLEYRVEAGTLKVRYEFFKQGLSSRQALS